MAQIPARKCGFCNKEEGDLFCEDCHRILCVKCRQDVHDKVPFLQDHKVTNIQKEGNRVFRPQPVCETHKNQFLYYCSKCECLTCAECMTSNHNEHKTEKIKTVADTCRQTLIQYIETIKTKIEVAKKKLETIDTEHSAQIKSDCEAYVSKVTITSGELHEIIDHFKLIHLTTASDFEYIEKQDLEEKRTFFKRRHNETIDRLLKFENLLQEAHDSTFLIEWKALQIEVQMNDEETEDQLVGPRRIESFNQSHFTRSVIDEIDDKFQLREAADNIKKITTEFEDKIKLLEAMLMTSEEDNYKAVKVQENLKKQLSEATDQYNREREKNTKLQTVILKQEQDSKATARNNKDMVFQDSDLYKTRTETLPSSSIPLSSYSTPKHISSRYFDPRTKHSLPQSGSLLTTGIYCDGHFIDCDVDRSLVGSYSLLRKSGKGEKHFPKMFCCMPTKIVQGTPTLMTGIQIGSKIGTDNFKKGTIGGFVRFRGEDTFLTCFHVFLKASELTADYITLDDNESYRVKCYQNTTAASNIDDGFVCGKIQVFGFGKNSEGTSIDAVLIQMEKGLTIDLSHFTATTGLQSCYLNDICIDYNLFRYSIPGPAISIVSIGAVSGMSNIELNVMVQKPVDIDIDPFEKSISDIILEGMRDHVVAVIQALHCWSDLKIPFHDRIRTSVNEICGAEMLNETKESIAVIVNRIFPETLQGENCDQIAKIDKLLHEVTFEHTSSNFSAIVSDVHMQITVLKRTVESAKRMSRRSYKQIYIPGIPFKMGDSGTCLYVQDRINPNRKGCIGMAIANHPDGGCIATPIMEILKYFQIRYNDCF